MEKSESYILFTPGFLIASKLTLLNVKVFIFLLYDNETLGAATCPSGYFGEPPSCSCFEDNTAYYENNVQMGEKNLQPSRLACQQSCSDHSECEFWTWAKKTPEGEGPCYLKHTRENVSPGLNGYISGSKQCLLPEANGKYTQYHPQFQE